MQVYDLIFFTMVWLRHHDTNTYLFKASYKDNTFLQEKNTTYTALECELLTWVERYKAWKKLNKSLFSKQSQS